MPRSKPTSCPPGKEISKKSGYCVKICKNDESRNPDTGRCIKNNPKQIRLSKEKYAKRKSRAKPDSELKRKRPKSKSKVPSKVPRKHPLKLPRKGGKDLTYFKTRPLTSKSKSRSTSNLSEIGKIPRHMDENSKKKENFLSRCESKCHMKCKRKWEDKSEKYRNLSQPRIFVPQKVPRIFVPQKVPRIASKVIQHKPKQSLASKVIQHKPKQSLASKVIQHKPKQSLASKVIQHKPKQSQQSHRSPRSNTQSKISRPLDILPHSSIHPQLTHELSRETIEKIKKVMESNSQSPKKYKKPKQKSKNK
jgi:hypothetical protein